MKSRFLVALLLVALVLTALTGCSEKAPQPPAQTQDPVDTWPNKPITIVVPFTAGGSADRFARAWAPFLQEELGVPVLVENRDGAAGLIGANYFMRAKADGYTLFLGTQPYLSSNILLQAAGFTLDDWAIINVVQNDPISLLVNLNSPYQTLGDLIEDIKAKPGQLRWGTIFGGAPYLGGLALFDALDLDIREVTYDGGAGYRAAVLGGQVEFVNGTAAGDLALVGQVRALTVYSDERTAMWPEAVPINEALSDYGVTIPALGAQRYVAAHASFREEYPERWEKLVGAMEKAFKSEGHTQVLVDQKQIDVSGWYGPEKSTEMVHTFHALMETYQDQLSGN
jgi:tripartite-type tricarboxylate transporter receptor subunit TctC